MKWRKLGLIFCADNHYPWMVTHASNPTAEVIEGGLVRVYFSTRDCNNRASIAWVIFSPDHPREIVDLARRPLLSPGGLGTFDDSGASMGCIAVVPGEIRLYYLGWNLGVTVPWRNSIGLALSTDGGRTFDKTSAAPLIDRHAVDPFSISYPWVLFDGSGWRMWYGSNLTWGATQREMNHVIKYAESADGLVWRRQGRVAIPLADVEEYALSKPCVIRDPDCYRMWFSHRGAGYRIGYAESADGLNWNRRDQHAGMEVSSEGWDAETVEYPCVFDWKGGRFMVYNGNGYGHTGFGLAVAE